MSDINKIKEYLIDLDIDEIKDISSQLDLNTHNLDKYNMIKLILKRFKSLGRKKSRYNKIKKLGNVGKEGTTYLVENKDKQLYAMKQFKLTKSPNNIEKEAELQKIAANYELSPHIYEVNFEQKFIVMEKLDINLCQILKQNNGELTNNIQLHIINIINKLDDIGIFHGDPNPSNFMIHNGKVYIIDFGFSKKIDEELVKKYTDKPNKNFMILGFVLKLREMFGSRKYEIFEKYLPEDQKKMFQI